MSACRKVSAFIAICLLYSLMTVQHAAAQPDQYAPYEPCEATADPVVSSDSDEPSNVPIANNDCQMIYQGQTTFMDILWNDYFPNQTIDGVKICGFSQPPSVSGKVSRVQDLMLRLKQSRTSTEAFTFTYTLCNEYGSDSADVTIIPMILHDARVKAIGSGKVKISNPNQRKSGYMMFQAKASNGKTFFFRIDPGSKKTIRAAKGRLSWHAYVGNGDAPAGKGRLTVR